MIVIVIYLVGVVVTATLASYHWEDDAELGEIGLLAMAWPIALILLPVVALLYAVGITGRWIASLVVRVRGGDDGD